VRPMRTTHALVAVRLEHTATEAANGHHEVQHTAVREQDPEAPLRGPGVLTICLARSAVQLWHISSGSRRTSSRNPSDLELRQPLPPP
jgi:hypothetical protein